MSFFRSRHLLLVLAVLFALALAVTVLVRRQPETALKTAVNALPEGVDLALDKIDYTHSESGVRRWRLVAEQVEHQSSSKQLQIRQPHLDFYDEQGELQGTLEAESGQVSSDYQEVRVKGDVVLRSVHGYTCFTETLVYNHTRHLASTDETVRLVGEGVQLTGRGLELDTLSRQLVVFADVNATFDPERFSRN